MTSFGHVHSAMFSSPSLSSSLVRASGWHDVGFASPCSRRAETMAHGVEAVYRPATSWGKLRVRFLARGQNSGAPGRRFRIVPRLTARFGVR